MPSSAPARRRFRPVLFTVVLAASACAPLPRAVFDPTPLSIDAPISMATRGRLLRTTDDPQACAAWLTAAGADFRPVADRSEGEFCHVTGAGTMGDGPAPDVRLSPRRPMMACPLAAAFAVWRRQSVEPAAREILGAELRQIDHLGVYACRRVNNGAEGRPSAHARADAIDIAGFRLSDGRRVTVARDWAGDTPQALFLRRIRDDACRVFGTALSPDYNALHADHLHLEGGRGGLCR